MDEISALGERQRERLLQNVFERNKDTSCTPSNIGCAMMTWYVLTAGQTARCYCTPFDAIRCRDMQCNITSDYYDMIGQGRQEGGQKAILHLYWAAESFVLSSIGSRRGPRDGEERRGKGV